ncbi:MAG: SDR family NAD(P)-dependent oxidoreductase [Deltaproteobacteria bacterium]|nr:SDR family NAD(P)-dependent oxidoreductase [Deltaproteobacteria bacterium]
MSEHFDWRGRTALVTGASAGIGAAVVRRLVAEGLNVVAVARREERLVALREELGEALLPVRADLRVEAEILGAFERAREVFGGVDLLVNNAGLGHHAPLSSGETEAWRDMLELNVLALCVCTRECIADLRRRGLDDGFIVHVSSMSGHRVAQGSGVYSATKHAVFALTEGLRQELREAGSKIRVGAVSPGFVETEFAALYHRSEEAARKTYDRYPCLTPDDVAEAIWWQVTRPAHWSVHDILMRPTEQVS